MTTNETQLTNDPVFDKSRTTPFLILSIYPLITLPLFFWTYYGWNTPSLSLVLQIFFYTFGLSHFFSTIFIYMSSENRAHFSKSRGNIFIYFIVPALIFAYFGLENSFAMKKYMASAVVAGTLFWVVRAANFNHGTRQSYGVLQLMKNRSGYRSPVRGAQTENFFLLSLASLQFETMFLGGGHFAKDKPIEWITLAVALFFLVQLIQNYFFHSVNSWKQSRLPLIYLFCQASAYIATIYDMHFFVASSAVHYVEYHVLIMSRFSGFRGNSSKLSDRLLAKLVSIPALLLFVSIAMGVIYGYFWIGTGRSMLKPLGFGFAFGMVDGIFLFHYFVEAFIWRLKVPFYKRTVKFPLGFNPSS